YRRTAVSMIYQNYNLINNYSAVENIAVAMDISENVKGLDKGKIMSVLEELGIDEKKANRKASSLSGGEQQRVAIARSILTDSPIIVADEPTGNLDSKNGQEVIEIFKKLAREMNKCVIMVTHNDKLAEDCDFIYRIDEQAKKIVR
ncbi:MAG: ATP-binding cassette domain-containing protein, partial [Erysipelotrichaceae bacterium]|nr:ATP-binding cassette domain-containing protein [Erysipelotrichaceae bacterium]